MTTYSTLTRYKNKNIFFFILERNNYTLQRKDCIETNYENMYQKIMHKNTRKFLANQILFMLMVYYSLKVNCRIATIELFNSQFYIENFITLNWTEPSHTSHKQTLLISELISFERIRYVNTTKLAKTLYSKSRDCLFCTNI